MLAVYVYLLLPFCDVFWNNYNLANNSCVVISLTSWNFLNVFICFYITFNWLIKTFFSIDHIIIVFSICSWKIISQVSLALNGKTKSLFTPWKLESIKKSKYGFWPFSGSISEWYLFQLVVRLKSVSWVPLFEQLLYHHLLLNLLFFV